MVCSITSLLSCWQMGTQVRALSVLLLTIWMVVLVDFAIQANQTLVILTIIGCVYSLLVNSYVFFAVKTNIFIRWPPVCLLVTGGSLGLSLAILTLAQHSQPIFDTGGEKAHQRVKTLSIQLVVANLAQFISVNLYYLSLNRERRQELESEKEVRRQCFPLTV